MRGCLVGRASEREGQQGGQGMELGCTTRAHNLLKVLADGGKELNIIRVDIQYKHSPADGGKELSGKGPHLQVYILKIV